MGVSFGRVRIADLAYHAFDRALHPEWFGIRARLLVEHPRWRAHVQIIDGGHSVVFSAGDSRSTEVLAPSDALPDLPGLLLRSSVRSDEAISLAPGGRIELSACVEVEKVDAEVFRHLTEEMTLDASPHRLFHRFRSANRMAPGPVSHVRVETVPRGISVQAFHSFPEESAILRSQSLFEIARS